MAILQVLLVEDDEESRNQLVEDLPDIFGEFGVEAKIHPCGDFDEAKQRVADPVLRYDMVVSDTYKGNAQNRDAQVLDLIEMYRGSKFCPLVVFSSSVKPEAIGDSAFVEWADKGVKGNLEEAIGRVVGTGIPQLARSLHDELDRAAGSFLWGFLEEKWNALNRPNPISAAVLERIVRRRAAIQIGDLNPEQVDAGLETRDASEYYIYPAFEQRPFNLGDVLRSKADENDWRVILTPHCHLFQQPNQDEPRAKHILVVRTVGPEEALGQKLANARQADQQTQTKKLESWSRSPAQTGARPEDRHWYLPGFLDLPHAFCDFLLVESVPFQKVKDDFEKIATLSTPYAEALQASFTAYYSSVGLPTINVDSIRTMLAH